MNANFSAFIPVETISEANQASHAHWRVRQGRAKSQRMVTNAFLFHQLKGRGKPTLIHFTRFGVRSLDSDNLESAHKAIRDEIAKILDFDDRDEAVLWRYDQQKPAKGAQRGTGIRISWTPLKLCQTCGQSILPTLGRGDGHLFDAKGH